MSQNTARPLRRLFRFRLRGLLIAVALLAVVGGRIYRKQHERAVVAQLELLDCAVYYDYEFDADGAFKGAPNSKPPGPAWLRSLLGDDFWAEPRVVDLSSDDPFGAPRSATRPQCIPLLKRLPTLKEVWLDSEDPREYRQALPGVNVENVERG